MKHTTLNGKWIPDNGTFVKVPNEHILEVIQMLRENEQNAPDQKIVGDEDGLLLNESGEWYAGFSDCRDRGSHIAIPFPDFKALVCGKLPKFWCIPCTEESLKHKAWNDLMRLFPSDWFWLTRPGYYVRFEVDDVRFLNEPFGEVLQIETWAAVEEMKNLSELDEVLKDPAVKNDPNNSKRLVLHPPIGQKEIVLNVDQAIIRDLETDHLINELKQRGYTISKIY